MAEEKKQELVVVEEEQPRQFTFLNYLKGIKTYKWWVIGFSVGGLLAGYLGFKFILNPVKKKLSASYIYELAGEYEDTDTIRLVDGSTFNPYDLTSRENIEAVKAKKNIYAKINVDKLVDSNAITITKNVTYYNQNDANSASITYKIEANASLFSSDKIGKEFIYDLVVYAKDISTNAIDNFKSVSCFTPNFDEVTFDRQISQLEEQYNATLKLYTDLSEEFSDAAVASEDGKNVSDLRTLYTSSYIPSGAQQSFTGELSGTVDAKTLINYTKGKEDEKIAEVKLLSLSYLKSLSTKLEEEATYQESLDSLVKVISVTQNNETEISKRILEVEKLLTNTSLEIQNLKRELKRNGYVEVSENHFELDEEHLPVDSVLYRLNEAKGGETEWSRAVESFKTTLKGYRDVLEDDRITASNAYKYCYGAYKNRVNILNGGYVHVSGELSSFIGAAAGLAALFLLSSLVTFVIYTYKKEQ